jgi:hypothetical protein
MTVSAARISQPALPSHLRTTVSGSDVGTPVSCARTWEGCQTLMRRQRDSRIVAKAIVITAQTIRTI